MLALVIVHTTSEGVNEFKVDESMNVFKFFVRDSFITMLRFESNRVENI